VPVAGRKSLCAEPRRLDGTRSNKKEGKRELHGKNVKKGKQSGHWDEDLKFCSPARRGSENGYITGVRGLQPGGGRNPDKKNPKGFPLKCAGVARG